MINAILKDLKNQKLLKLSKLICKKMKTIKIFFLLIGISVSSLLYAQDGHLKCAPGCVYAQQLQGKNTVSCIDRVCSICHEKKEKERKEKIEAEKLAAQKRAQQAEQRKQQQTKLIADQKKQVAIQRQKAKENELVLVAPTPKVDNKKTQILSKEDREILELVKTNDIVIKGYAKFRNEKNNDDPLRAEYFDRIKEEWVTLKIIELENSSEFYDEERTYSFLNNDGNFIFSSSLHNKQTDYRVVNLKGQILFRNEMGISYLDEGLYIVDKKESPFKEILNIKTMESCPFPEELITNWGGIPNKKNSTTYTNVPYEGFKIAIPRYFKERGIHIYATWNLKILREKGYEFYPQKKYSGADQMLPVSYLENKDKCIAMFIFLHDLEDDYKITVKKISIYGFNSTENRFILFDQKNYSMPLDYHHLFTQNWFGNLK